MILMYVCSITYLVIHRTDIVIADRLVKMFSEWIFKQYLNVFSYTVSITKFELRSSYASIYNSYIVRSEHVPYACITTLCIINLENFFNYCSAEIAKQIIDSIYLCQSCLCRELKSVSRLPITYFNKWEF
jgi:hypothetical protein